jgi:tRNA dimethylallyltransferase
MEQRLVSLAEENRDRLLCIVGPTASGKTDLAIALAERVGGEIVSADSVQIYRGFDIGSGKPTVDERARTPHHVIDVIGPMDPIDAATYARLAEAAIAEVRARGRLPILCGGTYFWVRALVLGLIDAPPGDPEIRARHRTLVDEKGRGVLHEALASVDPASAARLHPNDVVRVSRALEIFELSGRRMSEWHAEHGFRRHRLDHVLVAPSATAEHLTERITARVDAWLAGGWISEVERLLARGYRDARPMSSVGYSEVRGLLEGTLPRADLRGAIVQSTRIFARRQRTWLKSATVEWL